MEPPEFQMEDRKRQLQPIPRCFESIPKPGESKLLPKPFSKRQPRKDDGKHDDSNRRLHKLSKKHQHGGFGFLAGIEEVV